MTEVRRREMTSPKGTPLVLLAREGTSDHMIATSILDEDEYRLRDVVGLTGTALDVGAHIGAATLALLADHPDLRVVAIEPLAENVEMIRANLAVNGWTERATVIEGAIGTTSVEWDYASSVRDYEQTNRYVGHLSDLVDVAQQTAIVPQIDPSRFGPFAFAKWDCEGCEWTGLGQSQADQIVGEWHGDPGPTGISALLAATHELTFTDRGAVGLFFGARR